ncbi:MAG: A/G-specific adenine glycosylase [Fulvimonas sp.]|nr:A/G-specific adenine glycosylase [Fulvimonas sp.]
MSADFATRLLAWYDRHGRHDLPWQAGDAEGRRDPYRVWLAEVMLQQTQVATVIAYFQRFVAALPSLRQLAEAEEDHVLALWSGLGYYRRARFLQRAARVCVERHGGELPRDFTALAALPGIGRSTAGAILAQAHGLRFPILDGNVKRVLARHRGIHGHPGQSAVARELWRHADACTPAERVADYTQAIMDLGATVCTRARPACARCPLAEDCIARRDGLTAMLPTARPRKALPTRRTVMLVLRDPSGRILLERRPPQGVWPGLWSLPETADHAQAWPAAQAHARLDDATALAPFVHVFTHYRLHVEPLLFDGVQAHPGVTDRTDLRWSTSDELATLGLPAPVRQLLQTLEPPAPTTIFPRDLTR